MFKRFQSLYKTDNKSLEFFWLMLIGITLFNTFLGEEFSSSKFASIIIALTLSYKGFTIIDHFMELKGGNKILRWLMKAYFIVFPSMIIVTAFI